MAKNAVQGWVEVCKAVVDVTEILAGVGTVGQDVVEVMVAVKVQAEKDKNHTKKDGAE